MKPLDFAVCQEKDVSLGMPELHFLSGFSVGPGVEVFVGLLKVVFGVNNVNCIAWFPGCCDHADVAHWLVSGCYI